MGLHSKFGTRNPHSPSSWYGSNARILGENSILLSLSAWGGASLEGMGFSCHLSLGEEAFSSPPSRQDGIPEGSGTVGLFSLKIDPKGQDGRVCSKVLILLPSTCRLTRSRNEETQARSL